MSDYRERANERWYLDRYRHRRCRGQKLTQEEALEGHEQKESMQPSADNRDPKIAPCESIRGESVVPVASFC